MVRVEGGVEGRNPQTVRTLIAALHPDLAVFAHAAAAPDVDWQWVLDRAQSHKVDALIASRLLELDLTAGLSADLRRRVDEAQRSAIESAERAVRTLSTLRQVFGEAGIDYFVVKGSVLAHEVYAVPRRRRFSDVDVVVRAADVERVEAMLHDLGYRLGVWLVSRDRLNAAERAAAEVLTRQFADHHLGSHDWAAPAGNTLLFVDVHWRITPDRLPSDEAELWSHLRSVRLGDEEVRTLSRPAALLHLAAHVTRHFLANFRLLHLCDLAWAVQRYADDLPATWQLAQRWGMQGHVERVFALVEDVLQVAMPRHPGDTSRGARHVAGIDLPLLLDAPSHSRGSLRTRLGPELRWALAMRSLQVNVATFMGVSRARVQLQWRRRRLARVPK